MQDRMLISEIKKKLKRMRNVSIDNGQEKKHEAAKGREE